MVPFLISDRALAVFQEFRFTGYRIASVDVAKIATKGKNKQKTNSGEPEDAIMPRKDVKSEVAIPTLHAVYVTGRINAIPDNASGRSPSGYISPFDLCLDLLDVPDLFRPVLDGQPFSAWAFCSARFRDIILKAGLTNIAFISFDEFMTGFRNEDRKRLKTQQTGWS